ncbi:hypothetical protein [Rhodopirellula sp. SWK7]|uniref:hypothetical protein n=1 Tax=Rhodopirellula sp. SWK7 TaxID=595460 RepID=UPI0003452E0D|nr:hypothetical protein [Rhodopirellula sp. SWK7]
MAKRRWAVPFPRFDHSPTDQKCRRKLAAIAWDRESRVEIHKLADAIAELDAGVLSPHDVNDRIHNFHNGVSRELWSQYSQSDSDVAVYRAHYDGVLTDDDLTNATEGVRDGIRQFEDIFAN